MQEEEKSVQSEQELTVVPTEQDILNKINSVTTTEELKDVTNLFNLNITKKEMARVMQQSELYDLVLQQAGDRLRKRPDELSTKDLIDYMNAFRGNIDKTQSYIDKVENSPTIQVNNDNKKVVVNINNLNRDASEEVLEVVNTLLGDEKSLEAFLNSIISADVSESDEGELND